MTGCEDRASSEVDESLDIDNGPGSAHLVSSSYWSKTAALSCVISVSDRVTEPDAYPTSTPLVHGAFAQSAREYCEDL